MLRWMLAGLLLVGLLAAVSCGDDDDGADSGGGPTATLQQGDGSAEARFFAEWVAIHSDVNDRIDANSEDYSGAFNGDLEETKISFPIYVELFDEFGERAGALEVPDTLKQIVAESLAVDTETSVIHHARADRLADATTYAEVDEIFGDDPAFTALFARGRDACLDFQATGEEHGIEFERECD